MRTPRKRWLGLGALAASIFGSSGAHGQQALENVFPHVLRRGSFVLHADVDQPLLSLAQLGERALARLRPWIGRGRSPLERAPLPIYLCGDQECLAQVERAYNLERPRPQDGREVRFVGGYYPTPRLIAIPAEHGLDMRWDLIHEIAHDVYSDYLLGYLISINEGIAEFAAERILEAEEGSANAAVHERRDWLLGQLREVVVDGLPPLEDFALKRHWDFLQEPDRGRNYALAWSLVRFLNLSRDPAVRGRFGEYLARLSRSIRPWDSFREVYDVATVERLWHEYVRTIVGWTVIFGEWEFGADGVMGKADAGSSSWVLNRQQPARGHPYRLSFKLSDAVSSEVGVGFVFGHRSFDDFYAVELRGGDRVLLLERRGGQWQPAREESVSLAAEDLRSETLSLDCDAEGVVTLRLGGSYLASWEMGEMAFDGFAGLFLDVSGPPGASGAVIFRELGVEIR